MGQVDRRLRALIVSDIHDDLASIERLDAWLTERRLRDGLHIVLAPGDLSTAPQTGVDEGVYEGRARHVLKALAKFAPVYYVPGNHDALTLYNATAHHFPHRNNIHNVHGQVAEVAPGLRIMGWGGSSSAPTATDGAVWPGWPYDEPAVSAGYDSLLHVVESESRGPLPPDSILVMPHCGPSGSGTTAVTGLDPNNLTMQGVRAEPIESGSRSLRAFLATATMQVNS